MTSGNSLPTREVRIEQTDYTDGDKLFELYAEHGDLAAIWEPNDGSFYIANIDVEADFRGQGIGKALLQKSKEIAEEQVDIKYIYSIIISRECLAAMQAVFGVNNVKVNEVGTWESEKKLGEPRTSALLWYLASDQDS